MTYNTITALPSFSNIRLDAFEAELSQLLQNNLALLKKLTTQTVSYTWENLMAPMEDMDEKLQKLWAPISHLHSVADSEELREVYKNSLLQLSDYQMAMMQNTELFHAVEKLAASPSFHDLNIPKKKIITNAIRDFKLAGVHLNAADQKTFADLNQSLSQLSTQFQEHLLDATQAWTYHTTDSILLAGLPEHAISAAQQIASQKKLEGWLFTLDMSAYLAVMTYADSEKFRQDMYCAYNTRASDQGPHAKQWDNAEVMEKILATRHQMAALLGFNNYAEYSLATKMAKTPEEVIQFLRQLSHASLEKAQHEFEELKAFAKTQYNATHLNPWDIAYYSEKLRQHAYDVSKEAFRPYFPDTTVVSGLFNIIHKLYGVTFKAIKNADTWHESVTLFEIHDDAKNSVRGYLYLDLYARTGKRDGAWMNDAYSRRQLSNGDIQVPIGFVTCNFNAPVGNDPALLTHDDVTTLFHECGHALQHLLTTVDEAGVAGITGIPWDAVEIASQFMENWGWEKTGIDLIAAHYQTQEPLPISLFDKLVKAKNFQSAIQTIRQLQFSLFDFRLHLEYDPDQADQIQRILDEVRAELFIFPIPTWNRFQHSFSHIFSGGYAAGYYSYKWAEVLACDAFSLFEENGVFDPKTGQSFMQTFLESGGAKEPMDLFITFRGRPPKIDALLRHHGIKLTTAETIHG